MATLGEILKQQRETRGVPLREVAEATKIHVRYLEALEQNRFDILPGGVFNRGFVRAYAVYIGVDPDAMVARYRQEAAALDGRQASAGASDAASGSDCQPVSAAPSKRRRPRISSIAVAGASSRSSRVLVVGVWIVAVVSLSVVGWNLLTSRRIRPVDTLGGIRLVDADAPDRQVETNPMASPPGDARPVADITAPDPVTLEPMIDLSTAGLGGPEPPGGAPSTSHAPGDRGTPSTARTETGATTTTTKPAASGGPRPGAPASLPVVEPGPATPSPAVEPARAALTPVVDRRRATPSPATTPAIPTGAPGEDPSTTPQGVSVIAPRKIDAVPQVSGPMNVELVTTRRTWVWLQCDSRKVINRMVEPGEMPSFDCLSVIRVSAPRDAGAIRLWINGAPCMALGEPGAKVYGYTIRIDDYQRICPAAD